MSDEREPRTTRPVAATSLMTKLSSSAGVIAAMVLAVLVNIFVARHYKRWDVTKGGLYTLNQSTLDTLHALEEPIQINVLLSSADPQTISLGHLLDAYRAETTRLDVRFLDPDRHPAEFLAVRQRYNIETGKTDNGQIVTDAAIVVVRGERPFFITSRDLVEVDDADDVRARPRMEQALTTGIRSVLSNEQPIICFSTGHGEVSSDASGGVGLSVLKDKLIKNNFSVKAIGPAKGETPEELGQLDTCRVLVVGGPSEKVPAEDVARFRRFVEKGGSAFIAVDPEPDPSDQHYLKLGLDDLTSVFGVKADEDFIFELDPKLRATGGVGETFAVNVKPHPLMQGLVKEKEQGLSVVINVASSLSKTGNGTAAPVPLLETSKDAFGMADFFAWAKNTPPPLPGEKDKRGPLVVGYAAELPKVAGSTAAHGARGVIVGSKFLLMNANWQSEELRGTAVFVESALSWLAARPSIVDIPNKPSYSASMRISDADLGGILRTVLIYLPLATVLLGIAVHLRRRGEERGSRKSKPSQRKKASE